MLTEVGDHREEDEREVKSLWHYKQIDKYQKKLMLKPVWT